MNLRKSILPVFVATFVFSPEKQLAAAQAPPAPAASTATPANGEVKPAAPSPLEQAKERFERGRDLFKQQMWGAALAEFLESRRLYPTWSATSYSALCLKKLGRYDEALDTFAVLVRDFTDKLPANAKEAALREVEDTRGLVGTIEIEGSEPGAMIVVNQRHRGDYPLLEPLRVPAGSHIVRLYKAGYEPFETRVDVAGRTSGRVNAKLVKLQTTGTLKVVESSGKTMEVVIDAIGVGFTPWEGLLAPGKHTVVLRGDGHFGTQPATVVVERDGTTPLTLAAEKLESTLRIQPSPAGAMVAIDGVEMGRGSWEGRLRAGVHRVEITAEGFVLQVREVILAPGKIEVIAAPLERDPSSPLWQDNRGRLFVEIAAGPGFVPSFGGDIVAGCNDACSSGIGFGVFALGRGGYRFPSGFVLGFDVGYSFARQAVSERATHVIPAGLPRNPGAANDTLSLHGAMMGASFGVRLGKKLPVTLRLGAGALIGSLSDRRTGTFHTMARENKPEVSYAVDAVQTPRVVSLYVSPEARIGFPLAKRTELSLGMQGFVLISLLRPTWEPRDARVLAATDGQGVFSADTLMSSTVFQVAPSLALRHEF